MSKSLYNTEILSDNIVKLLSRELKVTADAIQLDKPLTEYGLDSIAALTIAGELEEQLGLTLPSTLLWDCPTVEDIAKYLNEALHADLVVPETE